MADSTFRPVVLRGKTPSWRRVEWAFIAVLVLVALALRAYHLSAEGFADDEIHKWLAANRYLHGDFGGDDVEHPMIMKGLIALTIAIFPKSFAPETLTRIPNVVAGAVTVLAIAQLGKRLFGKAPALVAATMYALSPMAIGYGRIAKEDTLYTLFLIFFFLAVAEAKSAADDDRVPDQKRWEMIGGAMLGLMFASKYQVFILPFLPPLYFWLRAGGSKWRVSFPRLIQLGLIGIVVMLALDWAILMPSTWAYLGQYTSGHQNGGDRGTSESILFMGRLYDNLGLHIWASPPLAFFAVFAAVKMALPTVVLIAIGLGMALWKREAAHRLLLLWLGIFLLIYFVMGVKYGRYFIPMDPPLLLLGGYAAVEILARVRAFRPSIAGPAFAVLGLLIAIPEATATVEYLPHPRLYLNMLGGGDAGVDYFFPHCDYFDAGLREAILAVARQAEPNAEITAEPSWVVRYYADTLGRHDIQETMIRPEAACLHHHVCYVIVQTGRLYWHNQAALERLAQREPWTTVDVAGHRVIRVYRLNPDEVLFPPDSRTSSATH